VPSTGTSGDRAVTQTAIGDIDIAIDRDDAPASFVINQFIFKSLPYDPDTAFAPVSCGTFLSPSS
jgi:hypothetical protein